MIELAHVHFFPVDVIVALKAVRAEPSVVYILMARDATRRNSKESLIEIFDFDRRALSLRNTFGVMTSIAVESSVLALEGVAGLLVVEFFDVPFDQGEILAVMF